VVKFSPAIQRLVDAADREERRQRGVGRTLARHSWTTPQHIEQHEASTRFARHQASRKIVEVARKAKDQAAEASLAAQAEAAARYAKTGSQFQRVMKINADPKVRAAVAAYKQAEEEYGELLRQHMGYD